MPAGSLMLHEAQCFRRNFRCPKCGVVMHVDQKEKHLAVAHSKVWPFSRNPLGVDQFHSWNANAAKNLSKICCHYIKNTNARKGTNYYYWFVANVLVFRLVKCVYCGMEIAYNERFTHQNDCGGRTATCPHCTKIFKRRGTQQSSGKRNANLNVL